MVEIWGKIICFVSKSRKENKLSKVKLELFRSRKRKK